MKKTIALLLSMAMAMSLLAGCSSGSSESTSAAAEAAATEAAAEEEAEPADAGSEDSEAAEEPAEADEDAEVKDIYILIKNRGDLSYWDSMADGGDRADKDYANANVYVIETTEDMQANLTAMYEAADKGAALIISAGDFMDNMMTVSEEYPDIAFLMVNDKMLGYDNVYSVDFRTSEAGFLAGVAAADIASQGLEGTDASKVIGFIGGMDETIVIQEFFMGYIQGAKYYDPDITVVYNYVGDYGDPDKGRTQALAQYNDAGADVIFACAGGSGNGVHQAAAETGKYVIGVDSDQSLSYSEQPDIQSRFVTSVLKNLGNAIYAVIGQFLEDGTLPFGEYDVYGLAEESVGIVENDLFNEYVSDYGKEMIAQATDDIVSGAITVSGAIDKDQATIQAEIAELLQ